MLANIIVVNNLLLFENKIDDFFCDQVNKIDVEVKFVDPKTCKKIASENQWGANFIVDIDEILKDSALSVVAEVDDRLACWTQIAFKTAYVGEIEKNFNWFWISLRVRNLHRQSLQKEWHSYFSNKRNFAKFE